MNQELIGQIKKLRAIEPDSAFKANSRNLILSHKTKKPLFVFNWPVFAWSGAIAMAAVLLTVTAAFFSKPKEVFSSSFDAQKLNKEFSEMNINIQLKEIGYQQNVNQTITSALSEISQTQTKHLNASVLEKEKNEMEASSSEPGSQIEELLNQAAF